MGSWSHSQTTLIGLGMRPDTFSMHVRGGREGAIAVLIIVNTAEVSQSDWVLRMDIWHCEIC